MKSVNVLRSHCIKKTTRLKKLYIARKLHCPWTLFFCWLLSWSRNLLLLWIPKECYAIEPYVEPVESSSDFVHPISLTFVLILSSHLRLHYPPLSSLQVLRTKLFLCISYALPIASLPIQRFSGCFIFSIFFIVHECEPLELTVTSTLRGDWNMLWQFSRNNMCNFDKISPSQAINSLLPVPLPSLKFVRCVATVRRKLKRQGLLYLPMR